VAHDFVAHLHHVAYPNYIVVLNGRHAISEGGFQLLALIAGATYSVHVSLWSGDAAVFLEPPARYPLS